MIFNIFNGVLYWQLMDLIYLTGLPLGCVKHQYVTYNTASCLRKSYCRCLLSLLLTLSYVCHFVLFAFMFVYSSSLICTFLLSLWNKSRRRLLNSLTEKKFTMDKIKIWKKLLLAIKTLVVNKTNHWKTYRACYF